MCDSHKLHPSITVSRVMRAVKRQMTTLANPGFCVACGRAASDCEPDAEEYKCKSCGKNSVFGAAYLLERVIHT